jgi:Mrr N-terminal domain
LYHPKTEQERREITMARSIDGRQTPGKNFRIPILQALVDAGGHIVTHSDLIPLVGAKMTFVDADLELRPDGSQKWMRRVGYVVGDLRKDGLIKPAARNGYIISDDGRERLTLSME